METILSQDQHDMGLVEASDTQIERVREAARGVIFNHLGHIAVMHFTTTGSYKLPGGGLDKGESSIEAFHREIREETGWLVDEVKELGLTDEVRYFCGLRQISYCFTAVAYKFVGTELTEGEKNDGMVLQWAKDIDEAIKWIESSETLLKDESAAGLAMMIAREVAILKAAKTLYE